MRSKFLRKLVIKTQARSRLINKDGSSNIKRKGDAAVLRKISWFHVLVRISNAKFLLIFISLFILFNFLYACIYFFLLGVDDFIGFLAEDELSLFLECTFFSIQTFTTVGYGNLSPVSGWANFISGLEAFNGLSFFALLSGLIYGRFSHPKPFIVFSRQAVIGPYKDQNALMMRLVLYKNMILNDAVAKVSLYTEEMVGGELINHFYDLPLEKERLDALLLSWKLVHLITPESPLYKITPELFARKKMEIIVYLKAFDDVFNNTIVSRTSYKFFEVQWSKKFTTMFALSPENDHHIKMDHIDEVVEAHLNPW